MKSKKDNMLDYIPEKSIKWETGDDGNIYLLKEKSRNKIMKKIIDMFGKSQYFRIHLDKYGSTVWKNIDGRKNVKELSESLKKVSSNEEVLMAAERVSYFIALMMKNKFVKIVGKDRVG